MRIPRSSGFLFVLSVLQIILNVRSHHGCPFHYRYYFGRPYQSIHHCKSAFENSLEFSSEDFISQIAEKLSNSEAEVGLRNYGSACVTQQPRCNSNSIYYSYDGSCNNLQNPSWGQSGTQYNRLMPANYADSKCALRKSSNGNDLPVARIIRTTVLENHELPSRKYNILFYAFGQWVDHDVTGFAPMNTQTNCCASNKQAKSGSCLPIVIPERDQFYSQFGVTCLDLKRANNTHALNCDLDKPCVPINFQTSFLDLSIMYGPNQQTVNDLRLFQRGLLKFTNDSSSRYQLFPPIVSGATNCPLGGIDSRRGGSCFKGGDIRVNQNPEITTIELLFYKLHQLTAVVYSTIYESASDEEIFQKTRRMLIAIYQHIIYSELVPLTVGQTATTNFDLKPREQGYATYRSQTNPQTLTEYSFAAGRAPHSLIKGTVTYVPFCGPGNFVRYWDKGSPKSYQLRHKYFNQRFLLETNVFESLIQSYANTDSNAQDEFGSEETSNYLLSNETSRFGSDLEATDILRGLDAGLQPYNYVRGNIGLRRLLYFEDMVPEVSNFGVINKLKSVYHNVDDVDLYVGGLAERPLYDSSLGPTFTQILAESFSRWKFGDRLFYEFKEAGFSSENLNDIRKITFAHLLCMVDPSQKVPKNAFLIPSPSNPLVNCNVVLDNGPQSRLWKLLRSTRYL